MPLDAEIVFEVLIDRLANTATPKVTYELAGGGTKVVTGSAISIAGSNVEKAIDGDWTVGGQTTGLALGLYASNIGQTNANTFQAIFTDLRVIGQGSNAGTTTLGAGAQNGHFVFAGNAAETINGSPNRDDLFGAGGNNTMNGGGGADTMNGGAGNDTYYVDNTGDVIVEASTGGTSDWVATSVSYALSSSAYVEKLSTTSSAGTTAINLTGNGIAQAITGNAGNNIISGKGGNDILTGGAGSDTFQFDTALSATSNVDQVTDYNVAADTMRLENAIFTALTAAGTLASGAFASNSTGLAGDSSDRIIYEKDTGELYYDANGSAAGGGIHFATLTANLSLTNADFFIV